MEIKAQLLSSKEESLAELPLSVSKVKTFEDCKAKYRFCYIEKLPRKEWDFHVFGQFVHEVLENFHKDDEGGADNEIMARSFKKATSNFGAKLTKDQKDEASKILTAYLERLNLERKLGSAPTLVGLEKPFYIDIALDGKPHVLLNGFIDRVQVDSDGILHVADYKTTKNKKYLNDFFQLMTYAFVLMLEDPAIEKVRASFILLRHNFEFMTKEYRREDVVDIKKKFIEFAEQIAVEKLWRPSPKFLCKYCDYLDGCEEGTSYLTRRGLIKKSDFGLAKW